MLFYFNVNLNQKNNKSKNKLFNVLFFKDQLKYLKTVHAFHLINPSPWPLVAALTGFMLTTGLVLYMHKFIGGFSLLFTGFCLLLYVFYNWWRDVVRESLFENQHYVSVQKGLKLSMILFIVSEIMFFFAFFWGFFHVSIAPAYNIGGIWPPCSLNTINTFTVPLTNTFILLSSGITITWAHHSVLAQAKKHTLIAFIFTLMLALLFTSLQSLEYVNSPFNISDGVYGSVFYLATGFHGFHVIVGTLALFVSFLRNVFNHFTNKHHLGFEFAIWYWHFVGATARLLFLTTFTRILCLRVTI